MRIITPILINPFKNKIFNIHPSLLPKYTGLMDLDIHNLLFKIMIYIQVVLYIL